jgi:ABC-type nickel/cobalt efflux system permease component RcnA
MAQHLRQLGGAELAGSAGAVGKRGQPDAGLLVHRFLRHIGSLMPTDTIALGTAAMLGVLHALEIDHMVAVTTFVSRRPSLRSATRFGFRWGVGHSVAVLLAGGVLLAAGVRWPEQYDALGEGLVGLMLVGLGFWALAAARKLHLHPEEEHGGHAHLHLHGPRTAHEHRHQTEHAAARSHEHGGITLVGLLHGLAGTTGVLALVPVTMVDRVGLGLGYLAAFGVGVTMAMTLFALAAAALMRRATARSLVWGRRTVGLVGLGGIGVGLWWLARAAGL